MFNELKGKGKFMQGQIIKKGNPELLADVSFVRKKAVVRIYNVHLLA